jgi:hypothetical protein
MVADRARVSAIQFVEITLDQVIRTKQVALLTGAEE